MSSSSPLPPPYDQINEPPPPYSAIRSVSLSTTAVRLRRTGEENELNEKLRRMRKIFIFNLSIALACLGSFLGLRDLFCSSSDSKSDCYVLVAVLVFGGVLLLISSFCLAYRYALMKRHRTKISSSFSASHHY